ncbi:MAG: AI-2E family transporter [Deltaproteobacteria bacterium]|jgi:predicted PurR-regulated permease PerM|nr:AI-2E family transporter [Deltaproteobacteria bacterium]
MSQVSRLRKGEGEKSLSQKLFLGLAIFFMLAFILINLKIILLPMLMAFFIYCCLNPLVNIFIKWHIPRLIANLFAVTLGILIIWLSVNFVIVNITHFQEGLPEYKEKFDNLINSFIEYKNKQFNFITMEVIKEQLSRLSYGQIITSFFNSFFSLTGYIFLTIIFVLYFLPSLPSFPDKLRKAFPGEKGIRLCESVDSISHKVQNFILVKSCISLGMGILTGLTCYFFNVDFASSWGIFAFFLHFVPTVGTILSILLPVLLAALQHSWTWSLWLGLALVVPSAIVKNFIEPLYLGRSVNLSPATSLMAIVLWGVVWGGVGMIIAVPATAVIKLTMDSFEDLKPIGTLMGK